MRPLPTQNEKMLVQSPSFHYFSVSRASESVPVISPWPGYETTAYMQPIHVRPILYKGMVILTNNFGYHSVLRLLSSLNTVESSYCML